MQCHVGVRHAHTIIAVLGGSNFGLGRFKRDVALNHEVCCTLFGFGHVLGNLRHAPLRRNRKLAAVFMQRAIEHGKQGRLTGAVAPD